MNNRLFIWSLTASLSGFLFGFDTVVISGAEKSIQELWQLSNGLHGLAIGMALWGTVLGAMVGAWPADRIGRRKTLVAIGVLYFVSAVWSGLAGDVHSFMIARFLGGLGVGISTVAAPLYISEIAPPDRRGRLAGLFQFNIVFGILIAFLSNYLIGRFVTEDAWRWMLGIEAVPALVYTVLCFGLPQSPRWLIGRRDDRIAARAVLQEVNPAATDADLDALVAAIVSASKTPEGMTSSSDRFWTARLRVPILLAFLVAFFNQLSGINAILYFAPRIFELAGLGKNAALLNSVGIGVTNLIFTFAGLYLIDRLGRRTLLYLGSVGYIVALGGCAWAFAAYAPAFHVANAAISVKTEVARLERATALAVSNSEDIAQITSELDAARRELVEASVADEYVGVPVELDESDSPAVLLSAAEAALADASQESGSGGTLVMFCIFAFIAAHAIGQGTVIWVLISEIFPNQFRAMGQSLGCFSHWIFAALLTTAFPWMIGTFAPAEVFGFFCLMMVLQLVWVATMVPETKGVSLEEMERRLGIS